MAYGHGYLKDNPYTVVFTHANGRRTTLRFRNKAEARLFANDKNIRKPAGSFGSVKYRPYNAGRRVVRAKRSSMSGIPSIVFDW